ncbi:MAG: hypothetical protein ACYDH5_03030 [Acidimicrobiales bacterium]
MLFKDDDHEAAEAARSSPVAPAQRSRAAINKVHTNKTAEGYPVHSFKTMLADLGTICLNKIKPTGAGLPSFTMVTSATPLQRRALELLGVSERLGAA